MKRLLSIVFLTVSCGAATYLESPEFQQYAAQQSEAQAELRATIETTSEGVKDAISIVEAVLEDGKIEPEEAVTALQELIPALSTMAASYDSLVERSTRVYALAEAEALRLQEEEGLPEWLAIALSVAAGILAGMGTNKSGPFGPIFTALGDAVGGASKSRK